MAVGLIIEIPGTTSEMYDEVNGKANAPDDLPEAFCSTWLVQAMVDGA